MSKEITYHLNIGEVILCSEPSIISTVLGSCISVCLFSRAKKIGGMIHYAHPKMMREYGQDKNFRYGEIAIPTLIDELIDATGEASRTFVAKIVGGASEIDGGKRSFDIGFENTKIAKEILSAYDIPIVGEDTGGTLGRKVLFHTATNRLQVSKIQPSAETFSAETFKEENKKGESQKVYQNEPSKNQKSNRENLFQHQVSLQNNSVSQSTSKKRKVLIVDDSKVIRDLLKRVLSEDPDFEIIASAADAQEAHSMIKKSKPDVITLDIYMPKMTGVEWLEKLLPENPIPVVMISSLQLQEGNEVFRALELGAVDYIQKPTLSELPVVGPLIREKVKEASFAKVRRSSFSPKKSASRLVGEVDVRKVLAIGASTGGTEALKVVMVSLPAKIPPTVIVQHIPPVFSKAFAERLNELCPFEVKEAEDGDELKVSRVLIAPGGKQMKIVQNSKGLCVRITDDAPMNRHKPSIDYLFNSVASIIGKNSVGVILTGMGSDGAKGLLEMKKKGSRTLSQDEATSVVYGMPKVAFEIGASERAVPLEDVAKEILLALGNRKVA